MEIKQGIVKILTISDHKLRHILEPKIGGCRSSNAGVSELNTVIKNRSIIDWYDIYIPEKESTRNLVI